MNIYKKSVLAVLCAISAASYAADTTPSSPNTAPAKRSKNHKKCDCASKKEAVFRKEISSMGLDPDSPQGQVMLLFIKRMASDPKLHERLLDAREDAPFLSNAKLSPTERLRALQLMKATVTASPNDCKAFLDWQKAESLEYLQQMSPQALQNMLGVTEISVRHEASDDDTSQSDTIEERLETHKFLRSALKPRSSESPASPSDRCENIRSLVDHVNAAPEPVQSRASLALLNVLELQPSAPRSVLRQPETYLNEAFDERVLPESIRSSLPPDGSRPLPFKRAVFDMELVNKATPTSSQRLTGMLINRRDNGVVASILAPAMPSQDVNWVQFSLVYGTATLRSRLVEPTLDESLANLQDAAALAVASQPLKEGATLHIPLPQPNSRGEKERVCTVGSKRPASTIFEKLTGSAIDLHCKQTSSEGVVTEFHDVWLADYQSDFVLSAENQYGRTELVIHSVTFE